jgi:hypothetical protein
LGTLFIRIGHIIYQERLVALFMRNDIRSRVTQATRAHVSYRAHTRYTPPKVCTTILKYSVN